MRITKKRRGRPFGKSLDSPIFIKNVYVKLQCTKCKTIYNIHINRGDEVLYTEEYKTNYICLFCKGNKRRK